MIPVEPAVRLARVVARLEQNVAIDAEDHGELVGEDAGLGAEDRAQADTGADVPSWRPATNQRGVSVCVP